MTPVYTPFPSRPSTTGAMSSDDEFVIATPRRLSMNATPVMPILNVRSKDYELVPTTDDEINEEQFLKHRNGESRPKTATFIEMTATESSVDLRKMSNSDQAKIEQYEKVF